MQASSSTPSSVLPELVFGFRRRLPFEAQNNPADAGLACLSMIAAYHGARTDLATLRRQHASTSSAGTLSGLMRVASEMALAARPVKFLAQEVTRLRVPCVLVWDGTHFVVLKEVRRREIVVHDPALGVRTVSLQEAAAHLDGTALEIWPNQGFKSREAKSAVGIRELVGRVTGLHGALLRVFLIALALEATALLSPKFLQWVVDGAIRAADVDLLTTLAIGFGLLLVLQALMTAVRSRALLLMTATLSIQWRSNVLAHLLRLPVQYFQQRHLGDIASRFTSIDQIQNALTTLFVSALLDGLLCVVTVAMMYSYSPALGSIALGIMLLYAVIRWASFTRLREATEGQIELTALQKTHFLESLRAAKTIKLFQGETLRGSTWSRLFVDQANAGLKVQRFQITYASMSTLLLGLENVLVLWLGASMVLDGSLTVGMLLAVKAYKDDFDRRVSGLIDRAFEFRMLKLQAERLGDIVLSEPEPVAERVASFEQGRPIDIGITGLQFRYSKDAPAVLDGLDLRIEEGESVALVGSSGCGKTTLMHVLLGVLEPTAGDVTVGGVSTRRLGNRALRGLVGTVTQDDTLLAGSIADNISFFDPDVEQAWIEECARVADIHEEIVAMPMGYHSLVGDMGTVLSGGQRQRILLARALYRRPRILFLDEATSHLDVERERRVNAAIQALKITRLIIAHRAETIASASRVVRIADGKIASDSSHPTQPEAAPVYLMPQPPAAQAAGFSLCRAPAFLQF